MTRAPRPRLSPKRYLFEGTLLPSEVMIARELCRRGRPGVSLREFVAAAWPILEPSTVLEWNWHIDAIANHLEALILDAPGTPTNLLINVPPGTMKSLIMAVFLPAWVWTFRPSWRAIFASGTPSVVTRDSLKCRNLIKSDWYRETFAPRWEISKSQDEKQLFANTAGGFRMGVGAGGSITGERADFLGTDDPNDAKEVHAKPHRTAINERWWDAAWHNRVADPKKSKRALIMQRLHEDDLAGYLLAKERSEWAHLCLTMEYESAGGKVAPQGDRPTWIGFNDPRSSEGELLFPSRFTVAYLRAEKVSLGSAGYAGQMQQRPTPATGNRFKRDWWRFWSLAGTMEARPPGCSAAPPRRFNPQIDHLDEIVGSWDCTFKDTDGSDYVAGGAIGFAGADCYVLELKRERMGFGATKDAIKAQRERWRHMFEILIEDKANGTAVIETLSGEISGIIAIEPYGGKEARAAAIEPSVEAGNVFLPEGAEWLGDFIGEFAAFPLGKNDDCVDMLSQAIVRRLVDGGETADAAALLGVTRK